MPFLGVLFLASFVSTTRLAARVLDLSPSRVKRAPYRLVSVKKVALRPLEQIRVTDLDQNGVSELLVFPSPYLLVRKGPVRKVSFLLMNFESEIIQEEPILGSVVATGVLETDVLDAAGSELVIGYQQGNQLRCRIWNYQSLIRKDFLLYERHDTSTVWDPVVVPKKALDVNFDGLKDLLIYFRTGHGRMPRGWLVLDPRTGKIMRQALFGGPPSPLGYFLARDFDHDNHMELVLGTNAPENHVEAGGISDLWAYLLVYDLVTGERELSKIIGPYYGTVRIVGEGPEPDTWITAYSRSGGTVTNANSRLSLFRWKSSVPIKELQLVGNFDAIVGDDYDSDGQNDIYCYIDTRNEIWVISRNLELIDKIKLKNPTQEKVASFTTHLSCLDVNADGHREVVLDLAHHVYILDSHLRLLASFGPQRCIFRGPFFQGLGESPLLATEDTQNVTERHATFWRLQPTPFLVRYGPSDQALKVGFAVLVFGVLLFGYITYRRTRSAYRLLTLSLDALRTQVISVDSRGQVVDVWGHPFLRVENSKPIQETCREKSLQPLVRVLDEWQRTGRLSRTNISLLPSWANTPLHVVFQPVRGSRQLLLIVRSTEDATGLSREHWRGLARRLAHEVKNPLTTVNLTLQQLQSESMRGQSLASEQVQRALTRALAHSEHLRAAVQRFVKLANPAQRNLQRLKLNVLLQQWSSSKAPALPDDIKLLVDTTDGLPPVYIDPDQIHEVLNNLLENAINAMPEGGIVRVTTRVEHAFRRDDDSDPRDYIIIEFKDSGKGISPDLLGKIFEPGFTTSPGGTGMGLFIIRKIIEDHGGFVDVTSAVDLGTVVTIYLPVEDGGRT